LLPGQGRFSIFLKFACTELDSFPLELPFYSFPATKFCRRSPPRLIVLQVMSPAFPWFCVESFPPLVSMEGWKVVLCNSTDQLPSFLLFILGASKIISHFLLFRMRPSPPTTLEDHFSTLESAPPLVLLIFFSSSSSCVTTPPVQDKGGRSKVEPA